MATTLSPDQQAVLQLVVRRARSYPEIADLLGTDAGTIRERAHAALARLDPAPELSPETRAAIADYALGQGEAPAELQERLAVRGPEREHLTAVLAALVATEIADPEQLPPTPPLAGDTHSSRTGSERTRSTRPTVSRTGGAIVLGLILAAIVLVVLWATGVIDRSPSDESARAGTTTARGTTGTTSGARVEQQINMRSTADDRKEIGVANVVSQDGERAIAVVASGVRSASYYGLWLRSADGARFLGFFQAVSADDDGTRRLQATTAAPKNLASFRELVITREPNGRTPARPGRALLRGAIAR